MEKKFDQFLNEAIWRMKFICFFRRMTKAPFWQAELLAFALAVMWLKVSFLSVWQNAPGLFNLKHSAIFYTQAVLGTELLVQILVAATFFSIGWLLVATAKVLVPKAQRLFVYRLPFVGRIGF